MTIKCFKTRNLAQVKVQNNINLKLKNMKTLKIASGFIIMLLAFNSNAQNMEPQEVQNKTNLMNATITHTLAYTDNGVERPYKVTIRKKRKSEAMLSETDINEMPKDKTINTESVAVLLTITNTFNSSDDRVISMRYDKSINDTFTLESKPNGFLIHVDERTLIYTMGKGISFPTPSDKNYFQANEFDIIK